MHNKNTQNGATLIIGLIMLLLIMVMVFAAARMSSNNTQAVANMQFRDQAIAAANVALEETLTGLFSTKFTAAQTKFVDMNNDGTNEFTVTVSIPVCVEEKPAGNAPLSSANLNMGSGQWEVLLDFSILAVDATTGARAAIRSGQRRPMSDASKISWCG